MSAYHDAVSLAEDNGPMWLADEAFRMSSRVLPAFLSHAVHSALIPLPVHRTDAMLLLLLPECGCG
jgi:hypothetical protein